MKTNNSENSGVELFGTHSFPMPFGNRMPGGLRRYQLVSNKNGGATGRICKAIDYNLSGPNHQAVVAVKICKPGCSLGDEAKNANAVESDHVVSVKDAGITDEGIEYIVYQWVDGIDLEEKAEAGALKPREAAGIMAQIARGVARAHSKNVIHNDIKPANIMIDLAGKPMITDFGYVPSSGPYGTPAFAAPEQAGRKRTAWPATDVFQLGATLFYLLTKTVPAHCELPLRFKSSTDLDRIIERATQPKASDRYDSAGELADDLERFVARKPIPWTKPSGIKRTRMLWKRNPVSATLAAALIVVSIGAFAGVWEANRKAQAELEAIKQAERDFIGNGVLLIRGLRDIYQGKAVETEDGRMGAD